GLLCGRCAFLFSFFVFRMIRLPPRSILFPYTTLFRSLLEEILSFRMQGVEFDNGDMYVDGHKAASDVRDEFVSVTEKQPYGRQQIGRAVQQECRDRPRMPSSA